MDGPEPLTYSELETLEDLCRLESSNTSDEGEQSLLIDLAVKIRRLMAAMDEPTQDSDTNG